MGRESARWADLADVGELVALELEVEPFFRTPPSHSAVRLDIDDMMQWGGIRAFARLAGEMRFNFYGDQIEVKFESRVGEPPNRSSSRCGKVD
jgi:hypothetical protein